MAAHPELATRLRRPAPAVASTPVGHRPTTADVRLARLSLATWRWLTSPRVTGVENLPADRPALLVGNHTTLGVLDAPLLVLAVHEARGVFPRALGDHVHFRIPGWRTVLARFGVFDGTPGNVRALMGAGEWILLFPGGAREVFKRRDEKYTLLWGERTGFARLAIESGYPIVPFAAVGAEDMYDMILDADDLLASPIGPLLRRLAPGPDLVPPVVRGLGPTLLPRPQRFYFHFGEPVETRYLAGRQSDARICFAIRERVRRAVDESLRRLILERERDPDRALLSRVLAARGDGAGAAGIPPMNVAAL